MFYIFFWLMLWYSFLLQRTWYLWLLQMGDLGYSSVVVFMACCYLWVCFFFVGTLYMFYVFFWLSVWYSLSIWENVIPFFVNGVLRLFLCCCIYGMFLVESWISSKGKSILVVMLFYRSSSITENMFPYISLFLNHHSPTRYFYVRTHTWL